MPKLTVQLTQHTPILQFHAEAGAGLRGTELKPALDRFLLRHCPVPREWLQPNSDEDVRALQYRVKIVDTAAEITSDPKSIRRTGFFAAGLEKADQGVVHMPKLGTGATVTFLSAHQGLLDCIAQWVGPFFATTNFGYRKTKGFGCYTVQTLNGQHYSSTVEADIRAVLDGAKLYELNTNGQTWEQVLASVAQTNAVMKSGINLASQMGSYDRSILMKQYGYAVRTLRNGTKPAFSNEKRMMKQGLRRIHQISSSYDNGEDREYVDCEPGAIRQQDYRFIRAMLGFADQYTFRDRAGKLIVTAFDVATTDAANPKKGMFRMESPLLFKPVNTGNGWRVFIVQRPLPKEIFDRAFWFTTAANNFRPGDGNTILIRTPKASEFDLEDFLDFVAAYDRPQQAKDAQGRPLRLMCRYPLIREVK